MNCICNAKHVYTARKGKVYKSDFINETLQGYRVKNGIKVYEHIVYKKKLRVGWQYESQKPFYTECSFLNEHEAIIYAEQQILCMETFYEEKLQKIKDLKFQISQRQNKGDL
ncbi:MAG: hypothetical protein MK175_01790 [Pseudoalteromonas sp.]|jgi:hypothetical protein|uniref:hypothetical protein n=1 Tax=Pseudoalteromonas sp. TaxID=53249 RepID=UPI0025CDCC28|nr:hypothetical protein [Pseudoalteromonas sp.]MCH2085889.1 hypothetical protein [Pseudoalteromonas sp.]